MQTLTISAQVLAPTTLELAQALDAAGVVIQCVL